MVTNTLTKTARAPWIVHLLNPLMNGLVRAGVPLGPLSTKLLTVTGRKSGQPRTTPVGVFAVADRRYLFSTFGEVNWVRNLRHNGEAVVTDHTGRETYRTRELPPEAAAAVLQAAFVPYLASRLMRPLLRAMYRVRADTTPQDYVAIARRHPVFELRRSALAEKPPAGPPEERDR